jgi:hypothetical protein
LGVVRHRRRAFKVDPTSNLSIPQPTIAPKKINQPTIAYSPTLSSECSLFTFRFSLHLLFGGLGDFWDKGREYGGRFGIDVS